MSVTRRRVSGLLLLTVAGVCVWLLTSGGSGYQLRVLLSDADGLTPGSLVKVGGVAVGSVTSLTVTRGDHALAVITLNADDAPVGRNAHLYVRDADLLGEKYLDLQVGDRSRPAPSGATIPISQTGDPVDIDQVLDVLDPSTRDRLAVLLDEAGAALFGRGYDISRILHTLPPTLGDVQSLLEQASADNQTLADLLGRADSVVDAVAADRGSLASLVGTAATALHATAERQEALSATIADSPATVIQLGTTLRGLDAAGAALRPASAGLTRTAPALTETLHELPPFDHAAQPVLAEIENVAPFLRSLGDRGLPLVRALQPTAGRLATFAADSGPLTETLDSSAPDLLGTLQDWALAIQPRDGAGHQFRATLVLAPQVIKALLPVITAPTASRSGSSRAGASAGGPARRSSPARPAAGGGATPASGGQPGSVLAPAGGAVKKILGALRPTLAPVTGITQSASHGLSGLLHYLLGK